MVTMSMWLSSCCVLSLVVSPSPSSPIYVCRSDGRDQYPVTPFASISFAPATTLISLCPSERTSPAFVPRFRFFIVFRFLLFVAIDSSVELYRSLPARRVSASVEAERARVVAVVVSSTSAHRKPPVRLLQCDRRTLGGMQG